jgi:multiple sugar transport system substrate-binding protein
MSIKKLAKYSCNFSKIWYNKTIREDWQKMSQLRILSIILLVLTIGYCTKAESVKRVVDLEVWLMYGPESEKEVLESWMEGIEKEFKDYVEEEWKEKETPEVRISFKPICWDNAWGLIMKAIKDKTPPDVIQLGTTWVASVAYEADSNGVPLKRFTLAELGEIGGREAFWSESWRSCEYNSEIVAIPWFIDVRVIFFRTDIFGELNLDPRVCFKDRNSFMETCKIITRNIQTNRFPGLKAAFGIAGRKDPNILHQMACFIFGAGGRIVSLRDGRPKVVINSKEALDGVNFYVNLVHKGYASKYDLRLYSHDINENFINGEYAMVLSFPGIIGSLEKANTKAGKYWRIYVPPTNPPNKKPATFIGGSNLAIFRSKDEDQERIAWLFVRFIASKGRQQVSLCNIIGFVPSLKIALDSEELNLSEDSKKVFKDTLEKYSRTYPSFPGWGSCVEPPLIAHLTRIWKYISGDFPRVFPKRTPKDVIKEILEQASSECNKKLEDWRVNR